MTPQSTKHWTLNIRLSRERKTAYVRAAQRRGLKLLAWMWEQCDREANFREKPEHK